MALEKCMTIQELILKAILKTYYELVKEEILQPDLQIMKKDKLYEELIEGSKQLTHGLANVVEDMIHAEEHQPGLKLSSKDLLVLLKEKKKEYVQERTKFVE